jgi:hypothetical protein
MGLASSLPEEAAYPPEMACCFTGSYPSYDALCMPSLVVPQSQSRPAAATAPVHVYLHSKYRTFLRW